MCRTYWPPLYAFIRREGYDESEAKDLTQEFFLKLIERDYLRHLRHQRGKFRSFILTVLKHFLQEQRGKAGANAGAGRSLSLSASSMSRGLTQRNWWITFHQTAPSNAHGPRPCCRRC
ncbi:MAG: RNA polymerase sigma factor [Verrucomicrobiales bacterium]